MVASLDIRAIPIYLMLNKKYCCSWEFPGSRGCTITVCAVGLLSSSYKQGVVPIFLIVVLSCVAVQKTLKKECVQ